jgi:hypothetical protein
VVAQNVDLGRRLRVNCRGPDAAEVTPEDWIRLPGAPDGLGISASIRFQGAGLPPEALVEAVRSWQQSMPADEWVTEMVRRRESAGLVNRGVV